jgi:hypothetical protein
MSDDPQLQQLQPVLREGPNALVRVKVPLWVLLTVIVGLVVLALVLVAAKRSVNLGPGVKGGDINVCGVLRDAESVPPASAEKEFEKALIDLGAKKATVRFQRPPDACPPVPTAPGPATSSSLPATTRR